MKQRIKALLALALMLMTGLQPLQAQDLAQRTEQATRQHWAAHVAHAEHGHHIAAAELSGHDSTDTDQLHQQDCHAGHILSFPHTYCNSGQRPMVLPSVACRQRHDGPDLPVDLPPPKSMPTT